MLNLKYPLKDQILNTWAQIFWESSVRRLCQVEVVSSWRKVLRDMLSLPLSCFTLFLGQLNMNNFTNIFLLL